MIGTAARFASSPSRASGAFDFLWHDPVLPLPMILSVTLLTGRSHDQELLAEAALVVLVGAGLALSTGVAGAATPAAVSQSSPPVGDASPPVGG